MKRNLAHWFAALAAVATLTSCTAPPIEISPTPASALSSVKSDQQHVFYRGADGAINHIFFDARSNKLFYDQWTQGADAPMAAGAPATMVTPDQQHVFYRGRDGAINHIFFDAPADRLFHDQWTQRTGAPAAASEPATMVTPNQQHVFYRGRDGAINHIFYDAPTNRLFHDQWTQRTGAPAAAGDPATMVTPNQQHIFYRDAGGAINHIFFDAASNKLFHDQWTQRAGAPAAAGDPVTMVTPNQQHVFYRGRDGAINHIFFDALTSRLFHDQWTQRAGAPAAAGDPATMVTANQQHIFYRGIDGAINHIFFDEPANKLFHDQWTQRAGAPAAAGDPATMLTLNQQHIFYRGVDGAINHIFFDAPSNRLFRDQWTQMTGAPLSTSDPATMATVAPTPSHDVLTQRNNNNRTGASTWPGLNQSSFSDGAFGLQGHIKVDGAVLAQPLFMNSVQFKDGAHSAIFVATSTNKIYAFDATPPFRQRWFRDLGEPYTIIDPYNDSKTGKPGNADDRCVWGLMTGIDRDFNHSNKQVMGIESTPIIDPVQQRLFVSYRNNARPRGVQRIAALDITTGEVVPSNKLFFDQWTQRSSAPAAAGDPATMVTPGQQHVFYRDRSGAINHIFFDGASNRLFRDQWTQRTRAPAAVGDPATMVTPGQQHVFYRGTGGAINHIFFDATKNKLFFDQWTQKTGAPAAAGDPATMVTPNQQHVFYRGRDGAINHIFFDASSNRLFRDQWTKRTGAPAAAGDPATMVTPNQQHVFYRDGSGTINHIFYDVPTNRLFHDQWTRGTGAPPAAGDPATMVTPNQQHVFYRDASGAINHVFYDALANKLFHDQWTQRTGAPPAAGKPATMMTPNQQHIFYRGSDGAVNHIFFDASVNRLFHDQWTDHQTGAPMAAGDPATMVTANQQHVFYRSADGSINHIFYDASSVLDRQVATDPTWNQLHRSRASLLLDKGLVYVGYSAVCEDPPVGSIFQKAYQGWVYAFDAKTLDLAGRYRSTEDTVASPPRDPSDDPVSGGGIWQASTGLAADGRGNIFFATGNEFVRKLGRPPSPPDSSGKRLSNSVVRLSVLRENEPPQSIKVSMTAADWFTPYRKVWQDIQDLDLGSAGVVLIPNTRYLVIGGKEGMLYLLDRGNLGKFDATPPFNSDDVLNKHLTSEDKKDDSNRDKVVQKLHVAFNQYCSALMKARYCSLEFVDPDMEKHMNGVTMDAWLPWPHIHGTPVFGELGEGRAFLYIWPEKDHLKSFQWLGNGFQTKPTVATGLSSHQQLLVLAPPSMAKIPYASGMPGGMLSLTVDPTEPGRGVLFASVQRCRGSDTETARNDCSITLCSTPDKCKEQHYGMLRAFDPITLRELWTNQIDSHATDVDKDYWFAKFVPPTIAMGRVYLATGSEKVLVYGVVGPNR